MLRHSRDQDGRLTWSHSPRCYETPLCPVCSPLLICTGLCSELPEREKVTLEPRVLEGKVKVFESDQPEFKS